MTPSAPTPRCRSHRCTASVAESFKSNESRLLICKPHYQSQQQAATERAISHIPKPWTLHSLSSVTWYKSIITQGNLMMKRCHISYHDEVIAKSFVLNKINRPLRGPWHACQCSWNLILLFLLHSSKEREATIMQLSINSHSFKQFADFIALKRGFRRFRVLPESQTLRMLFFFSGNWNPSSEGSSTCKPSGSATAVEPLALTKTPRAGLETSFSGIRVCFFIDMDKPHCEDELQGEEGEEQARLGEGGARVERAHSKQQPNRRCRKIGVAAAAAVTVMLISALLWPNKKLLPPTPSPPPSPEEVKDTRK